MDGQVLEKIYQENLEERIISYIAEKYEITYEKAMAVYYGSKLADKIHTGNEDIQYLDHKVLVQLMEEIEPGIFE